MKHETQVWNAESDPTRRKPRLQTVNELESRTVQSDRHKAEITEILRKYEAVGIIDHLRQVDLQYRDVMEFTDFADAARQLKAAENHFMTLPPQLRNLFNNSTEEWLDAAHDPEKLEALRPQLEEMGFLAPQAPGVVPADTPTPVVEPDSPPE